MRLWGVKEFAFIAITIGFAAYGLYSRIMSFFEFSSINPKADPPSGKIAELELELTDSFTPSGDDSFFKNLEISAYYVPNKLVRSVTYVRYRYSDGGIDLIGVISLPWKTYTKVTEICARKSEITIIEKSENKIRFSAPADMGKYFPLNEMQIKNGDFKVSFGVRINGASYADRCIKITPKDRYEQNSCDRYVLKLSIVKDKEVLDMPIFCYNLRNSSWRYDDAPLTGDRFGRRSFCKSDRLEERDKILPKPEEKIDYEARKRERVKEAKKNQKEAEEKGLSKILFSSHPDGKGLIYANEPYKIYENDELIQEGLSDELGYAYYKRKIDAEYKVVALNNTMIIAKQSEEEGENGN